MNKVNKLPIKKTHKNQLQNPHSVSRALSHTQGGKLPELIACSEWKESMVLSDNVNDDFIQAISYMWEHKTCYPIQLEKRCLIHLNIF